VGEASPDLFSPEQTVVGDAVVGDGDNGPVLVRSPYLRGLILNLIEMWAVIHELVTVHDTLIDRSQ